MRWTVLLPTHNRPDTLALSIASVLAQSDSDLELLVVGDGCTDDTASVVAGFADARVRWFDLPKGPGFGYGNRAEALETATGDYLALASHDDLWAAHHLAVLGPELDRGHDLAYSLPLWAVPTGQIVPLAFDLADPLSLARFADGNYIPAPFLAARMTAVVRAGGWPTDVALAADWRLMQRILAHPTATASFVWAATALHFRSVNRDFDHGYVGGLLTALPGDWPIDATIPVHEGMTGQQAAVAVIAADAQWWPRLERAALQIIARAAFIAPDTVAATRHLERQLEAARADTVALDEHYKASTSWRVTAPLRAILGQLRRTPG